MTIIRRENFNSNGDEFSTQQLFFLLWTKVLNFFLHEQLPQWYLFMGGSSEI